MVGRVGVPQQLTAQRDHQVAQQQQKEAVAAPPRHLPGVRAGCSLEAEGPGGRSAGGRSGAPELLGREREETGSGERRGAVGGP